MKQGTEIGLDVRRNHPRPGGVDRPATSDITRQDNPHNSFGDGVHYCLGAPLARLELPIAIRTLVQRPPGLQNDGRDPAYRPAYVIRGMKAFPERF